MCDLTRACKNYNNTCNQLDGENPCLVAKHSDEKKQVVEEVLAYIEVLAGEEGFRAWNKFHALKGKIETKFIINT